MNILKAALGLFFVPILFSLVPQTAFAQTEKLGIVNYTPPKGWRKTEKENTVTYSELDEAAGKSCTITLYGATPGTGRAQTDFAREWNNLVVKPLAGEANPKTETEMVDGWTAIAGGAAVDFNGTKAIAFLTVLSGDGKTESILGLFNDESYLQKLVAFGSSLDIRTAAIAASPPRTREESAPAASSATMNAGSLVMEFERNEIRAYQVLVGNRVRINGVVNSIDVKNDGRIAFGIRRRSRGRVRSPPASAYNASNHPVTSPR